MVSLLAGNADHCKRDLIGERLGPLQCQEVESCIFVIRNDCYNLELLSDPYFETPHHIRLLQIASAASRPQRCLGQRCARFAEGPPEAAV